MNLERLLSAQGLVQQSPSSEELRSRSLIVSPDPMKLFYGETFDDKGHTIDSMKYYFFLSMLAKALQQQGVQTDPTVLVADSAACRNVGSEYQDYYMNLGTDRAQFILKVNEIYNTGLHVVKMSDYINSSGFIAKRQEIMELCEVDAELMEMVRKTVPESKVEIERGKGFLYSFDEITTIVDLDVKIGPPREDLYDNVARSIAERRHSKGIMSLFLTPTFPLGMSWAYFFKNEGIEDHGITAYKAGSKRLHQNRIIVGKSNPDYIRSLINQSFISTNPALPNPTLDIGIICEMARKQLDGDDSPIILAEEYYSGAITTRKLKEMVGRDVEEVILSRF